MLVISGIMCGWVTCVQMTVDIIGLSRLHVFNDSTGSMGCGQNERCQCKHQRQKR